MASAFRREKEPLCAPGYDDENDEIRVLNADAPPGLSHGLTALTASLFIVGEMAGSGVLALPNAVANSGWIGVVLICILGILSAACGIVLSSSWLILRRDFREYQEHVRYPYAALGFHTYGKTGKYLVQLCINATLIGACTVFLLLASENMNSLIDLNISSMSSKSEYRIWLLILTAGLLPLTWLGTPKNFWPVALFAIVATAVACLLVIIKLGIDFNGIAKDRKVTTSSFFSAFGAIAFSFGGTAAFPTIQCDMRRPALFSSSIVMGYICVLALYLPMSVLGFLAFGDGIKDNVLQNLSSTSGLTKCVEALISAHLLFSFIIVINPVSQQLEEWWDVPKVRKRLKYHKYLDLVYHKILEPGRFTIKSAVVRSSLVLFILTLAQSIPHFGLFLNLVGSSTTTLLTFVFPCLFYLKLQNGISLHLKVFLYEIIVVGAVAAITSTYFAIDAIVTKLSS